MGLIINTSYFLSPILRFNKTDWIYLQSLPIGGIPRGTLSYSSYQEFTVIRLSYHTVSLLGLRIDKRVSIYIYWETTLSYNRLVLWFWRDITWSWQSYLCLTVRFYYFGAKWLGYDACTFYKFCFSFHMEVTCYLYVFHLWYRGNDLSWENLYYIIWY